MGVSSLFLCAGEGEEDGGHFVGAGAVELHGGGNGGGFPCRGVLGGVEGLETPGESVDAQVEEGTAGEGGVDHSVGVVGEAGFGRHAHGEVGGDAVDRAEVKGGDEVADVDGEGEVARPDCLHEEEVLFEGKGGQKTLRMT